MADPRPLIAHVIHRLTVGGLENGLVNLLNGLPEASYRHAVICIENATDFRKRIRRADVAIHEMHRDATGVWPMRRALFRLFRELRPAVVHTRNLSALDALLPARLAGVRRCVHGEHGRDALDPHGENRKLILLRRLHRPLVSHYISVSKDIERYLHEKIGGAPHRVTQIYNGVDTGRFAPEGPRLDEQLPPGFRGEDILLIGTVGRLDAVKDQASLVRAFAAMLARNPSLRRTARLVIVGDGPLRQDLEALAAAERVADRVWFPGALDRVPDALRSLGLFVLPSLSEGISNTILEAMATGLPIVATAVGGNVELLEDGVTGSLYRSGDFEALVAQLVRHATSPEFRSARGTAARASALARFSMDAMMRGYGQVYDRMLGRL